MAPALMMAALWSGPHARLLSAAAASSCTPSDGECSSPTSGGTAPALMMAASPSGPDARLRSAPAAASCTAAEDEPSSSTSAEMAPPAVAARASAAATLASAASALAPAPATLASAAAALASAAALAFASVAALASASAALASAAASLSRSCSFSFIMAATAVALSTSHCGIRCAPVLARVAAAGAARLLLAAAPAVAAPPAMSLGAEAGPPWGTCCRAVAATAPGLPRPTAAGAAGRCFCAALASGSAASSASPLLPSCRGRFGIAAHEHDTRTAGPMVRRVESRFERKRSRMAHTHGALRGRRTCPRALLLDLGRLHRAPVSGDVRRGLGAPCPSGPADAVGKQATEY